MKKSLLFSVAAVTLISVMEANADSRRWDFTKWSDATQSALANDALWTSDEKGNGTLYEGCYWYKAASLDAACDAEGNLLANGSVIAETQGLKVTAWGSGQIAIATDYQTTKDANQWGPYNAPQYLWLANKNLRVVIPAVERGTQITMGIDSHKPTDARGVDLYVGGTKVNWITEQSGYPTTYEEYSWIVPEEGDEETVDVELRPSNGCHLYFIQVGEDKGSETQETNIAYLYDSSYNGAKDADKNPCGWLANGGLEADPIYEALSTYNVTAIDYNGQTLTSEELNDSLLNFDVVVVGEAVSSGNSLAKGLVDIVNKVPMLNLKSFMYKNKVWSWGAGVNPSPKATALTIAEDYLEDPLFADLEISEEGELPLFECDDVTALNGNLIQAYTATADLIKDNEVLATVGGNLAIHRLGTKNQYLLIPISSDNMNLAHGNLYGIIDNAVKVLAATKSKVQNAAAPVVKQEATDGSTLVSISCTTAGSTIYYTVDGTEPTTASPVYAEPFVITADSTIVKAFAIAHGYNDSKPTTAVISVMTQAAAPVLSVENLEGQAILTLAPAEGTLAYFSFNGVTKAAEAQTYTEPVIIREPATITYFATATGKLNSAVQSEEITVGGIPVVKDTLAHFTSNEEDWFTNVVIKDADFVDQELPTTNWAAKAAYYWGKSAWAYYGTEIEKEEVVTDSLGVAIKSLVNPEQDSIKVTYKADPAAVKYVYSTTDTQWRLRSQGQILTGECNVAPSYAVGNGATGYYAEEAADLIGLPSKGKMTFGGKGSGEPYSGSVESLVKFEGSLDIVTYCTMGGTSPATMVIQTSADAETWATQDTLPMPATQRYYKKFRTHIEAAEPVYVRVAHIAGSNKAQLYDIYVISTEGTSGIENIAAETAPADARSYDLFGRQLQTPARGQLFIQGGKKAILR